MKHKSDFKPFLSLFYYQIETFVIKVSYVNKNINVSLSKM